MYYHFAILLLFRPLIKLRIIGSAILPRDVCSQAADAIQGLLRSYSQLYTLRRTPSFVPYFLLTSSIMHLAVGASINRSTSPGARSSTSTVKRDNSQTGSSHAASSPATGSSADPNSSPLTSSAPKLSPKVTNAIKQGIADLAEMAPSHHFAEQALNILRFLAKKWNIEVDVPYQGAQEEADKLVRPSTSSLNFFAPNISTEDFMCTWGVPGAEERKRQRVASVSPSTRGGMERMEGVLTQEHTKQNIESNPSASTGRGASVGPKAHPIKSADSALFWPFPMQGRPIILDRLEEAGFAPLY
jgi:hypothetical protein